MEGIENSTLKIRETFELYNAKIYRCIMEGDYNGRHFAIVNCHGHPCAYIEVKDDDAVGTCHRYRCDHHCEDCVSIWVHGGPTYYGHAGWNKDDHRTYVGWDYAHYGDYCNYDDGLQMFPMDTPQDKRWTIPEILMDVAAAWVGLEEQKELPSIE